MTQHLQLELPKHIVLVRGDLLRSTADVLVNTVNEVGVMGAGIAKEFRRRYPTMYRTYQTRCRHRLVEVGKIDVHIVQDARGARFVMNFPTKQHWRDPSQLQWIDQGLPALRRLVEQPPSAQSIAIPPLGCGNGGLRWEEVLPRIVRTFHDLPAVRVEIYQPSPCTTPPLPKTFGK